MDEKIEPPQVRGAGEDRVDRGDILDIAWQHEIGAERLRPAASRACQRLALIGEGELRALRRERRAMPQAIE